MKKKYFYSIAAAFCLLSVDGYAKSSLQLKNELSEFNKRKDTLERESDNNIAARVAAKDWMKAPNSYLFDPSLNNDGLYIPVRKAFAMWEGYKFLGYSTIPNGQITADVLWEDHHGLIKSGANYSLEIIGTGQNAKIKVPVNKSQEGNAVIAFRVNGEIFWSWHVWVPMIRQMVLLIRAFRLLKERK